MTTFGDLAADGKLINVREIKQSDLMKCPHCIIVAEHYRPDGSCKCNDPDETVMREWGYKWSKRKRRWT